MAAIKGGLDAATQNSVLPQHCVKCTQSCESRALSGFGRVWRASSTKLSTKNENNFDSFVFCALAQKQTAEACSRARSWLQSGRPHMGIHGK